MVTLLFSSGMGHFFQGKTCGSCALDEKISQKIEGKTRPVACLISRMKITTTKRQMQLFCDKNIGDSLKPNIRYYTWEKKGNHGPLTKHWPSRRVVL